MEDTAIPAVQSTESAPVESPASEQPQMPNLAVPSERKEWLKNGTPPPKRPESATEQPSATDKVQTPAPASEAGKPQEKKRTDADTRVKELLADRKQLADRVKELEAKAAPPPAEVKPVPAPEKPADAPKRPVIGDNETWDKYQDRVDIYHRELARWEAKQLFAETERTNKEEAAKKETAAAKQQSDSAMAEKIVAVRKKITDFDKVALRDDFDITATMDQFFRARPLGMEVLYHLASEENSELADLIRTADPVTASFELSKVELALSTPESKNPKAPRPPANIAGGKAISGDPEQAALDEAVKSGNQREYNRLANARDLRKRKAS